MGLIDTFTERFDIPSEPGEWVEVRRLGWRALKEAGDVRVREVMRIGREAGGELMREIQDGRGQADVAIAAADPLTGYDMATLLKAGIAAWSDDAPVTPENIALMRPRAAEEVARRVLALALPLDEAARKNA